MAVRVADLDRQAVAEALRLQGIAEVPTDRAVALRELRQRLSDYRTVRDLVERAPEGAREAFVRLASEGPQRVEALLDRGWAGRGQLPAPLDWLQRRALVAAASDGRVHAMAEARAAFAAPTLDLPEAANVEEPSAPEAVVHPARTVVVAAAETIDWLTSNDELALEAVSDTVALADADAEDVRAALRRAGVRLLGDQAVAVDADAPALPTSEERAVGPKQLRTLLGRAIEQRRRVWLRYFTSSRGGATTERVVDPWALDGDLLTGWCHLRRDERTFAVGRIGEAVLLAEEITGRRP